MGLFCLHIYQNPGDLEELSRKRGDWGADLLFWVRSLAAKEAQRLRTGLWLWPGGAVLGGGHLAHGE